MEFEILMSTMNREHLDFLKPIFQHNDLADLHLLIVNQTTTGHQLKSNSKNIRVINSNEKGSPSSRNLAIKNAKGDICLLADDDIIYHSNLKTKILDTYKANNHPSVLTFESVNGENKRYMSYPKEGLHTKKTILRINNVGISFKRSDIQLNKVKYNEHFGVGATFPGCTEYFFLKNALDKKLSVIHNKEVIVTHKHLSSGQLMGSDNAVKARTAQTFSRFGWLTIPWLLKYLYYMVKLDYIAPKDFKNKFTVGLYAIRTFRKLKRKGEV